jgi:hypothetical protein
MCINNFKETSSQDLHKVSSLTLNCSYEMLHICCAEINFKKDKNFFLYWFGAKYCYWQLKMMWRRWNLDKNLLLNFKKVNVPSQLNRHHKHITKQWKDWHVAADTVHSNIPWDQLWTDQRLLNYPTVFLINRAGERPTKGPKINQKRSILAKHCWRIYIPYWSTHEFYSCAVLKGQSHEN